MPRKTPLLTTTGRFGSPVTAWGEACRRAVGGLGSLLRGARLAAGDATAKHRLVFLLRSLVFAVPTVRWLVFLESFAAKHRLGPPPAGLARRSLATHLLHGTTGAEAVLRGRTHFLSAARVLSPATLAAIWAGVPVDLGRVEGRREAYRVTLRRADQTGARHEGELTLTLSNAGDGQVLQHVTFALQRDAVGDATVVIGGLQGSGRDDARDMMVAATRDLGGLRPKDALLLVLRAFAHRLGAAEIHGVSNATHVINRRRLRRRLLKVADYDSYWIDRGGRAGGPFGFVVPVGDLGLDEAPRNRRQIAKRAFAEIGLRLA